MKIGINASFLRKPGTGIGQVTLSFLKELAQSESGRKHTFVLYLEEDADISFLPGNFQKRVFLPLWKRYDVPRRWLWEGFSLPRQIASDRCDAFLSLYQSATVLKHIRHTMVVHDIIPWLFPEYLQTLSRTIYAASVKSGICRADRIIAVSQSTKSDLIRHFGIAEDKVVVALPDTGAHFRTVPSPEAVTNVLKKYDLAPGYIYHAGGLEVRKNAETLLRAYALLIEKEKSGTLQAAVPPLVISGKIFPHTNRLATDVHGLIEKLHLEEKVKLLGFVPDADLPALYRGALFFAYPSLYEGFGLPVLEALRMSVPVLTSCTSSLPEVGGDAVLYADPSDTKALSSQMERLLSDASLRATVISKSAPPAPPFSWEHFTGKVLEALAR